MDKRDVVVPSWSWAMLLAALLPGCAVTTHFAYTNVTLNGDAKPAFKASFEIAPRPKEIKTQPEDRKSVV